MAEHVRVDVVNAGECGSSLQHLRDAACSHWLAAATEPQLREPCELVPFSKPQIAFKRRAGFGAKRQDPYPVAFAVNGYLVVEHIKIGKSYPAHFSNPHTGIDKQSDHCLVTPVGKKEASNQRFC
jgi:hypothetical protein